MEWTLTDSSIKQIIGAYVLQKERFAPNVKLHSSIYKAKREYGKGPFLKATYKRLVREGFRFTIKEETIYHDEIQKMIEDYFDRNDIESLSVVLDKRQTPTGVIVHFKEVEMKLTQRKEE